jgi:signal transduction histidine kinase
VLVPPPRKKLAFRLTAFIVAAQAMLYAGFAFLIMEGNTKAVEASERETSLFLNNSIRATIDDDIRSASIAIVAIADNPQVLRLFAQHDRAGLQAYLEPAYGKIKDRMVRFHFFLPDGTTFLRVHDPSSYGDSLAETRPMIKAVIERRIAVSGIEHGRDGLGIRVVVPLFSGSRFLGAVEYGMEFGQVFAERLKSTYDGDYYIFGLDGSGPPEYIAGTRSIDRCTPSTSSVQDIATGKNVWSLDCSQAEAVDLYPFRDYAGNVIGFIKVELSRLPLAGAINQIRRGLIFLGVILLMALALTTILAMRALFRPLRAVVNQTRMISERIAAGDLGYRGDISGTAMDFREIITVVNSIIGTLREREMLLQAIVEGIPGVVYYVGPDYKVLWANSRARQLMPALVGMDPREASASVGFFGDEGELLAKAFESGEIISVEACYVRPSAGTGTGDASAASEECWEHVAVPVPGTDGRVEHVIRISRNVTDKRSAEAALRQLNETLERRIEDAIRMHKETEGLANQQSRLAAIGELATGMAHEITQPLNSITFSVENLSTRFANGTVDNAYLRNKVSAINADIDRVRRVIDHVRLFARSVPEEYNTGFSVNTTIQNALGLFAVQLATREIDLSVNLADSLPEVRGNPFQYEQVVLNLLSNARDAVEERLHLDAESNNPDPMPAVIRIRTWTEPGLVCLEVSDNGTGIPEELGALVFDPFFTTKLPGKGTGLGLSISFGIIREMGGSIELGHPVRGASLIVKVPAWRGAP